MEGTWESDLAEDILLAPYSTFGTQKSSSGATRAFTFPPELEQMDNVKEQIEMHANRRHRRLGFSRTDVGLCRHGHRS